MLLCTVVYLWCIYMIVYEINFPKVACCKTFLDVFSVDYKQQWAIRPHLQAHVMEHVFNQRV